MSETGPDPEDLAAELSLGVLDGAERAAAERRLLSDRAFAAEVAAWDARLARIALDESAEHAPPPGAWERIAARLDGEGGGMVATLRRSLQAWRAATATATGIAAALVVALAWPRPAPAPTSVSPSPPVQAASLAAKGGPVAFVAVLDPERRELVLTPALITASSGRTPQLWVIPTGGKPVSVGIAAFGRPVALSVDTLLGREARRTLAVSLEPIGGSPTGQPTGPVVATGELKAL